jgi:hypothetical protein
MSLFLTQCSVPDGSILITDLNRLEKLKLKPFCILTHAIQRMGHSSIKFSNENQFCISHLSDKNRFEATALTITMKFIFMHRVFIINFEELLTELGKKTLKEIVGEEKSVISYMNELFNQCLKEEIVPLSQSNVQLDGIVNRVSSRFFRKQQNQDVEIPHGFENKRMMCSALTAKMIYNTIYRMNVKIMMDKSKKDEDDVTIDHSTFMFTMIKSPFGNDNLDKISPDDMATRYSAFKETDTHLGDFKKYINVEA